MLQRPSITRGQRLEVAGLLKDAAAAIERLSRWKEEAAEVLNAWEGVWMIAGQPGRLGSSKAQGVGDHIQRLRSENEAWMNGVADVVEPLGYDRHAACGPSDLLPGLTELRNHDMEMTLAVVGSSCDWGDCNRKVSLSAGRQGSTATSRSVSTIGILP